MRAISHGNIYDIYDDTLKTYDKLPALTYVIRFSQNRGFYLEKYVEMEITESKIYGVHTEKVYKVLDSFEKVNRSLGVILSGDKAKEEIIEYETNEGETNNYWLVTAANAIRPLYQLIALAKLRPDCIWDGD